MNALEIKNLYKTFDNSVEALKGINLTVKSGDFFALLGPNGAGKSTTIGIITTLVNITSGSVKVYNHDIDQEPVAAKVCLGVVPQEINFNQFERVIDIVTNQAGFYGMPYKEALEAAEHYLAQLNLWSKRNEISRSLSGGMKRRLMIARGLIHQPKMLILDEPTAGVDIELRHSTWDFLQKINDEGTTIILTTHYLEEAEQLCRGIAIINHGQIVSDTTVAELLEQLAFETFILDLEEPIQAAPKIEDCEIRLMANNRLEIAHPKHIRINDIYQVLTRKNIQVKSMRNKSNRLEQLFINLVRQ